MKWIVRVGGQASVPSSMVTKYAPPRILSASPIRGGTAGGQVIRVTGTNLGLSWDSAAVGVRYNAVGLMDNTFSRALEVLNLGLLPAGFRDGIPDDMRRYLVLSQLGGPDGARLQAGITLVQPAGWPFDVSDFDS